MRMKKELSSEEYAVKKDEYVKEKRRLQELSDDTHHCFESWIVKAENTLSFANSAKKNFLNGDLKTKR